MGRRLNDADDAMHTLESANAFNNITQAVNWVDKAYNDKAAHKAYDDIMLAQDDTYNLGGTCNPVPPSNASSETGKHCYKCGLYGHIRKTCPNRRLPRKKAKKAKKSAKYWEDY